MVRNQIKINYNQVIKKIKISNILQLFVLTWEYLQKFAYYFENHHDLL